MIKTDYENTQPTIGTGETNQTDGDYTQDNVFHTDAYQIESKSDFVNIEINPSVKIKQVKQRAIEETLTVGVNELHSSVVEHVVD